MQATVHKFPEAAARPDIAVRVVHGFDELAMVLAIRAAVFLGEEECRYADEFDGNDLAATHLIALQDGEPAGAFRIRWFAGFARLERLAIRRGYRSLPLLNALVEAAMELCRRKGYRVASGQARAEIVRFWKRFGGTACGEPLVTAEGPLTPMRYAVPAERPSIFDEALLGHPALERVFGLPEGDWPEVLTLDEPAVACHG